MAIISALMAGLIFGAGLLLSGMANPAKVLGFLDLTGNWDPSLAFVMIGAISISMIAFLIAAKRARSLLGLPIRLPAEKTITLRLILGSALFGMGWGLAGFCPGPALVALGAGYSKAWGFTAALVVGMGAFEWLEQAKLKAAALRDND
jgi:uncharacterized membrane protein YedE/YeeE